MPSSNDDQAIVIKDLWGKVLSALVITGIMGGISFAFAQNGINAEVKTTVKNIQDRGHDRDGRLNRIDTKIDAVGKDVRKIEAQQMRIETKLDYLIENKDGV